MPFITLPDSGYDCKLGVQHTTVLEQRGTKVRCTIYYPTGYSIEVIGKSVCKYPDNFSKLQGRKLAYASLSRKLKGLTKDDKAAIFYALCPRFAPKNDVDKA